MVEYFLLVRPKNTGRYQNSTHVLGDVLQGPVMLLIEEVLLDASPRPGVGDGGALRSSNQMSA